MEGGGVADVARGGETTFLHHSARGGVVGEMSADEGGEGFIREYFQHSKTNSVFGNELMNNYTSIIR